MSAVVNARVSETRTRIGDLVELSAQLQDAATRLESTPATNGGCAPDCACMAADVDVAAGESAANRAAPLPFPGVRASVSDCDEVPIACSLSADDASDRMAEWRSLVVRATGREATSDGVALIFGHDLSLTVQIARLAAAEFECCSFLRFTVGISARGVRLEVGAPPDAQHLIAELFGVAAQPVPDDRRGRTRGRAPR